MSLAYRTASSAERRGAGAPMRRTRRRIRGHVAADAGGVAVSRGKNVADVGGGMTASPPAAAKPAARRRSCRGIRRRRSCPL